ncbi:MAG: efflux RND transporter permease subunit [Spirochaetales bacterium]|nr:efflux RND transporter permease subunit [Spirochaetales bacterium]
MKKIIAYFAENHILVNFLVLFVFIGAIYSWKIIPKEEMPDITADMVFVAASYPGATASEVEYFVTSEIEEALEGIDGIDDIESRSSSGSATLIVRLESNLSNYDEVIDEIKDSVSRVKLPEEILTDPIVRERRSANRSVMEIAIFNKNKYLLDTESNQQVQDAAVQLQKMLESLASISEVTISGVANERVSIEVDPKKLEKYEIGYLTVVSALRRNDIRVPAGVLTQDDNSSITVYDQLDSVEKIKKTIIQSSFTGQALRVEDVAEVRQYFEDVTTITKINGHQGILLSVRKTQDVGIIEATDIIRQTTENLFSTAFRDSDIQHLIYSDESQLVRDRLALVASNGLMGFFLILISLLIFLNFRSGIWVAMGIPFSMAATMIFAYVIGYSLNNMTLAAVIIVLGIVVDDAIIIAENIIRKEDEGVPRLTAITEGTYSVIKPILASVLTTCAAFVPLLFFEGMIGKMIKVIPFIIFAMLFASLLESIFILPAHMNSRFSSKASFRSKKRLFPKVENLYARVLKNVIRFRPIVYLCAVALLVFSGFILVTKMKYEMFPREEIGFVMLAGSAKPGSSLEETEKLARKVESLLDADLEKYILTYSTRIGSSRRGNAANTNEFSIFINLVASDQRDLTVSEYTSQLETAIDELKKEKGFQKLGISRMRFGTSSGGSPIEIEILENSDIRRTEIANQLVKYLGEYQGLENPDIERQLTKKDYVIDFDRDFLARLSVNPSDIAETLRSVVSGTHLFYHYRDDIEIPVKISIDPDYLQNIQTVMTLPMTNSRGYMIPMENLVQISVAENLAEIRRKSGKRVLRVYADIADGAGITPLEIAEHFEKEVFPEILKNNPTATLSFAGEVKETRDSNKDMIFAMVLTILLIYFILALLFNSLLRPILILIIVPFGVVGAILAFYAHGIVVYGSFAVIGILGLTGVVINDSIVMIDKLGKTVDTSNPKKFPEVVAEVSKTRLRAVFLTTLTTVIGLFPTAYGILGYDAMLSDMMLAMAYGLIFGTLITLVLVPCLFTSILRIRYLAELSVRKTKEGFSQVKNKKLKVKKGESNEKK